MKKLILFAFLIFPVMAHATTWYVRTDGGTATQCTGTTNAPYSGTGTAQACAYNHPFWLLDQSAWTWLISANDTVQFEDLGPYYIGEGPMNGVGVNWPHCAGDTADCGLPLGLPDGVKFYGLNRGACHNATHTALTSPTQLVGINALYNEMTLQATNSLDMECIDFTSGSTCTKVGDESNTILYTSMSAGTATYGWKYSGTGYTPSIRQHINVTGTTNGGGVFNITDKPIASLTPSTYSITNTQMTSGTATYTYTLVSGTAPANGDSVIINGTTNGGGAFNNVYGKSISNVTGTTFDITGLSGTYASQAESGTGKNNDSGEFTVAGLSGTVALATDAGTQVTRQICEYGVDNNAVNGLVLEKGTAQGPSNLTLKDIGVHGMAAVGIQGSHLNKLSTDVFTASDIYISGNGESGWDSDGGGCGNSCESIGTMNLSYITSIWNGCVEVIPNGGTVGGNGYNYCTDQANGGNGDGMVQIASGGTWNWSHIVTKWNMQDGLDTLHAGDDITNLPDVNVSFAYAEGNEGQSIKVSGKDLSLTNSIGIANCNVMTTASNFPGNPPDWNASLGMPCRANDAMAFAFYDNSHVTIENVTNIGEQNVGWDMSNANCAGHCTLLFKNNTSMGFVGPSGTSQGGFVFQGEDSFNDPGSIASNNAWWHIGTSQTVCPSEGLETNYVCTDPGFVAETDRNAINSQLTSTSHLIGKGVAISGLTTDFGGGTRPSPPSIGAWDYITNIIRHLFGGSSSISGSGSIN